MEKVRTAGRQNWGARSLERSQGVDARRFLLVAPTKIAALRSVSKHKSTSSTAPSTPSGTRRGTSTSFSLQSRKKCRGCAQSESIVVQQDGAIPHAGKGNAEILNSAEMGRGWLVELVTQPSQSPGSNINQRLRLLLRLSSQGCGG